LSRECGNIARAQSRQLFHRPLDILRPDVAAVDDDQILGPAGNDNRTFDQVAHVAGIKPTIRRDHLLGGLGLVEVASHQAWALDEDAADLAIGQGLPVFTTDFQLMLRQWLAAECECPTIRSLRCALSYVFFRKPMPIDAIDLDSASERSEADGQSIFSQAVTRQERRPAEPMCGKGF